VFKFFNPFVEQLISMWCVVDTGFVIIPEENDSENAGMDVQ